MNKRLMAALMAMSIMVSFTACDKAKPVETTTESTTEETTVEETTTTEETTEETTTAEETTTTVEATVTEESVMETTAETTTKAPTSKAKKSSAPTLPKGYKKLYWNKTFKGHKVYIAYKEYKGAITYKGWWKNKWVTLDYDEAEPSYQGWSIATKPYTLYYEVGN